MSVQMAALAYTNQGLKEHSLNTMGIALKYSDNYYSEACVSRINSALKKKRFSPSEFTEMVKIAAGLHDIGKGADHYQQQFGKNSHGKPSFYLHEIPSAVIAKKLMESAGYDSDRVLLVSIAILFHHTAMRPFDQQETCLKYFKKDWVFSRHRTDLDELSSNVLNSKFTLNRIGIEDAESFMDWIKRVAGNIEKSRLAKLYCLIAAPMIYGDNIDAKSRGGNARKSRFVEELEETIDV